ncbi:fish-egg lectin-like [Pleurodeles waltl]|uniref:fish-egg lectin-like n=1 Tax=Pleurodeles waltl TaxID=8319 RepID=UPI003709A172
MGRQTMNPSTNLLLLALAVHASGVVASLNCDKVAGSMVQVDAGNGQVFGVNAAGDTFTIHNLIWTQLPGQFLHVTVGAAGVWAVSTNNQPFKMIGGDWARTKGEKIKQLDAGGDGFLAAVSGNSEVFCLRHKETVAAKYHTVLPWARIEGTLKYYSCGPKSCWGVNATDSIYYRSGTRRGACSGTQWQVVEGKLSMIEVGSEGSVYGVTSLGDLYHRTGISDDNPVGTGWAQLEYKSHKFRHVSEDLDRLWLVTNDQKIYSCAL